MTALRSVLVGSAGQGLLTFGATLANSALAFLVIVIVGRGLGAAGAGQFFAVTAIFLVATSLLNFGADTGLVRFLSRLRALGRNGEIHPVIVVAVLPVIAMSLLAAATIAIMLPSLAHLLHMSTETASSFRWLGILLLPAALQSILLGATRGLGQVLPFAMIQNVAVPALRVAAVLLVLLTIGGVPAAAWAWAAPLVAGAVVTALLLRRALRSLRIPHNASASEQQTVSVQRTWRAIGREFWGFSSARGIGMVLERAIDQTDVVLIISMLGPAAGGAYGAVARCVTVGAMVESSIRVVMGPKISAALATQDREAATQYFHTVARNLILMAWPFYLLLGAYADRVLQLFGPGFETAAGAMRVVCLGMMLSTAAGMLQTFLLMGGKSRWQVGNRIAQWATLIVGVLVLSRMFGLVGAGLAWTISVLVDTSLAAIQIYRAFGLRNRVSIIARAAAPALVMGACANLVAVWLPDASVWFLIPPTGLLLVGYGGFLYFGRQWLALQVNETPPGRGVVGTTTLAGNGNWGRQSGVPDKEET